MRRSTRRSAATGAIWLLLFFLGAGFASRGQEAGLPARPTAFPTARGAIEPAAPVLPAEVVAAMQEARFEEARRALIALGEKSADVDDRSYYDYLRAVAERLAGNRDAARTVLQTALRDNPTTRWAAKLRYELAGVELAAGNLAAAEELMRAEATRLLAADRKDRLAEVYHAFAVKLLEPGDPVVRPDPNAAYELLDQARDLAKSPALRARFLEAMGRASLAAGNPARAVQNFEAYLRDFHDGADRFDVKFRLGEAQMKSNQLLPARLTWSDLARDIERLRPTEMKPELAEIRATALYEIASTYGIPNPPDDTNLNLGVAALRRFLAAAPGHPKAVRAAYSIAATYLARSQGTEAYDALTRFLKEDGFKLESDEARRDWAELSMTASFQVGPGPPGPAAVCRGHRRLERLPGAVPQRSPERRRPARHPRSPSS